MGNIIEVNDVTKKYDLGTFGTGSLKSDIQRWWARFNRKEDPTLKIGEQYQDNEKEFWALKGISFEVQQGEVLGIVGKNGAGKSTLLKILSRITLPTSGSIKVKGRIASLLEVGTGFHPELSGRDNIFLNGAILGMSKHEIKSKFDEIVDFSGVEKFIDTPVKRYSSGMYVRLAFGVAAHLEPEILIIDEVLAVGDAEFQKKCLGKMKAVSGEGRTVLFVSHNMTAINSLCSRCAYLKNGELFSLGRTDEIVNKYLSTENANSVRRSWGKNSAPGDQVAKLYSARLIDENQNSIDFAYIDQKIGIEYEYEILKDGYQPIPNIHLFTSKGENAFVSGDNSKEKLFSIGKHKTIMWIPANLLNQETYIAGIALSTMSPVTVHFFEQEALVFEVIEDINNRGTNYNQKIPGVLRPRMEWENILI